MIYCRSHCGCCWVKPFFFFFSRRPMLSSFAAQTEWTKQKLLLIRAVVQLLMREQVGEMTEHSVRDGPLKVFLDTLQPFVLRWYPKQFEIKVKQKKKKSSNTLPLHISKGCILNSSLQSSWPRENIFKLHCMEGGSWGRQVRLMTWMFYRAWVENVTTDIGMKLNK